MIIIIIMTTIAINNDNNTLLHTIIENFLYIHRYTSFHFTKLPTFA